MKLLELFQIIDEALLLEARIDYLRDTYGEKLATKYLADAGANPNVNVDMEKVVVDIFNKFVEVDPSPQKKFTQWLIKLYLMGNLKLEDLYKATEYIRLFIANAKQLPANRRDINAYKSLPDLYNTVKEFANQPVQKSNREYQKELGMLMHSPEQSETIYNSPTLKIVIPKTKEASCYFGKNTQWCTAAKQNNMFDYYNNQGKMYIILIKKENKRFQFHIETQQFMNENDEEIDTGQLLKQYPEIKTALGKDFTDNLHLSQMYVGDMIGIDWSEYSDDIIIKTFARKPQIINNMMEEGETITEPMWLGAMSKGNEFMVDDYLKYVDVPSEAVLKVAINNNPLFIRRVSEESLTEELKMIASQGNAMVAIGLIPEEAQERLLDIQQNPEIVQSESNPNGKIPNIKDMYKQHGITVELLARLYSVGVRRGQKTYNGYDTTNQKFSVDEYDDLTEFYEEWIEGEMDGYSYAAFAEEVKKGDEMFDLNNIPDDTYLKVLNLLSDDYKKKLKEFIIAAHRQAGAEQPEYDYNDMKQAFEIIRYRKNGTRPIVSALFAAAWEAVETEAENNMLKAYEEYKSPFAKNVSAPDDQAWDVELNILPNKTTKVIVNPDSFIDKISYLETNPNEYMRPWKRFFTTEDFEEQKWQEGAFEADLAKSTMEGAMDNFFRGYD